MALYKKPKNIRYTDMCIWVDEHAYDDDVDEEKMFQYLYHISNMLAFKRALFNNSKYYDEFAIYMATRLFMRYRNKKQFDDTGKKMNKIKSVLNYAKAILYSTKVMFEQESYAQVYADLNDEYSTLDTSLHSQVMSEIDKTNIVEFSSYLGDIPKTVRDFISKIPNNGTAENMDIYLSCMLSLLNSITLNNKSKEKIKGLYKTEKLKVNKINDLYKKERDNCIILYHLDNSFYPYVFVLVNELRHQLANNLSYLLNENIGSEINMKNLLVQAINNDLDIVESNDD